MKHEILKKSLASLKQISAPGLHLYRDLNKCIVTYKHYLLLFELKEFGDKDCAILDLQKETIAEVSTGIEIKRRRQYSICHWKDNIFVFYGQENVKSHSSPNHEVYLLYVNETESGLAIETAQINSFDPEGRSKFNSLQVYKDNAYVIVEGETNVMELWKFDLNQHLWSKCEVTGEVPRARNSSGIVLFEDTIYLIGGNIKYGESLFAKVETLNDLFTLNMEKMEWKKIYQDDFLPPKSVGLTKAEVISQKIYITSQSPCGTEFFFYSPNTNNLEEFKPKVPAGFQIKSYQNHALLIRVHIPDKIPIIYYQCLEDIERNLKADCQDYLSKDLTTTNFLSALKVAETADSVELYEKVVSFLVKNVEKVKQEIDIQKIPSELLMKAILHLKQSKIHD